MPRKRKRSQQQQHNQTKKMKGKDKQTDQQHHSPSIDSVVEEQRLEIAAFKTLSSDLDFAFNLQLQEAISASQNDTTTTTIPNQTRTENDNDAPNDAAFSDYADLFLEQLGTLEQERSDREVSEVLMREVREDLDRRTYDQRFATEIMQLPETWWIDHGDNYQKPYTNDAGSSSSGGSEVFRVFCKGVVSEERVMDSIVIVSGLGVAICDTRGNVVFEVSKKGSGLGGDNVDEGERNVVVETEALVEGLSVAWSLDLKRVQLLFDDSVAHQYVSGRVQPKEGRISTLVGELSLLQEKFADCEPILVARNDVKFAFKLARDAVVSQISWPGETSEGKKILWETCVICFEDRDVSHMFTVEGCLHRYCFSCMKKHVEVKLLNVNEVTCPHEGCVSEVTIESCRKFMDPKLVDIMSLRKREASIAVTEKVYCPYPKCSTLMSKTEVLEYTKLYYVGADRSGARKCVKCQCFFCIHCKVGWHYDMTCQDYRRTNPNPLKEAAMLDTLVKKKLWRQCVKCSHMIELAEGCYHIYCRCGYEFCYTCGAEWKNRKPTCQCKIWDERNIIYNRRQ